jgi:DNA-binding response OmpR family regulator
LQRELNFVRRDFNSQIAAAASYDSEVSSRTVDVHVAWLRQKLDNPQSPRRIQTVRGKGYKFTP